MGPGAEGAKGGRGIAGLKQFLGARSCHVLMQEKQQAEVGLRRDVDPNEVGLLGFGRIGGFNHLFGRNREAHSSQNPLRVDAAENRTAGVAETGCNADLHVGTRLRLRSDILIKEEV